MKKLMILLAVACLVFVSCGTKKATEPVEEPKCEFAMNLDKWATLNDEGVDQEALVAEMKVFIDGCFAQCEHKEGEEACPIKEEWANFDNLELDAKIALIDKIFGHMKECCEKEAEVVEEVAAE